MSTRALPAADLRASDADRDAVLAELSAHYQAGRLTADEFGDRSGRALAARTGQDLADVLTDLPAVRPSPPPARRRRPGPVYMALIVTVLAVTVNVVVSIGTGGHVRVNLIPWWLVLGGFFVWRRYSRR
jgi:Domain of unknown function (DUF1707)